MFISRGRVTVGLAMVVQLWLPAAGTAQKDYYNTDRNRPVRIEDAYATERYAVEVKLAPVRLERGGGGVYHWSLDPEIAYGVLPRTNLEVGFPLVFTDDAEAGRRSGLAGVEVSAFHNLNTETRTLPALGVRGDVTLPVGTQAAERAYAGVTGIATRTFPRGRLHVNARYTFGAAPDLANGESERPHGESRWLAGVAADRAFPLQSMLLIADVHASQSMHAEDPVEWHVGAGVRYQVNPYLGVDAGIGRRVTGSPAWYVTFGSAYHLGVRALMPRLF